MIQAINSNRSFSRVLALFLILTICMAFVGQLHAEALAAETATFVMMGLYLLVAFGVISVAQAQMMQTQMYNFVIDYDYASFLAGIASTIVPNDGTVFSYKTAANIIKLSVSAWVELKQFVKDFQTWVSTAFVQGTDGSYGIEEVEGETTLAVDLSLGSAGGFYIDGVPFYLYSGSLSSMGSAILSEGTFSATWYGYSAMQLLAVSGATDEYVYASYSSNVMKTYLSKSGNQVFSSEGTNLSYYYNLAFVWNAANSYLYLLRFKNGVYSTSENVTSDFPNSVTIIQNLLQGVDLTVDASENAIGGTPQYTPAFIPIDDPTWANIPSAVNDWFKDYDELPVAVPDELVDVFDGSNTAYPVPDEKAVPGLEATPETALPDEVLDNAGEGVEDPTIASAIPDIADDVGSINDALTEEQALDFSGYDGLGAALAAVFPFCIPWDIKYCVEQFQASGAAPEWTFNLGTSIGQNVPVVIDLSDFDNVALAMRSLFLIIFIFGLVLLTSKVIKW